MFDGERLSRLLALFFLGSLFLFLEKVTEKREREDKTYQSDKSRGSKASFT